MGSTFGKNDELNRPDLGNYKLKLPYAFYLRRAPGSGFASGDYESDTAVLDQLEDYTVDEPAAVVITPTQSNGKFITNRGSVLKDISFSGTTGFMPNDAVSPSQSLVGAIANNIQSTVNPSGVEAARQQSSGFIRFIRLRNLFRRYWQIKRDGKPNEANATFMFFYDRKLDEWWIVEPLAFRMRKSKSKPFTYDYSIQVKTIAPGSDTPIPTVLDLPRDSEITNAGTTISSVLQEMNDILTRLRGITRAIATFAGQLNGLTQQALNQVLAPLDTFIGALADISETTETIRSIPQGVTARVLNSLDGMANQVQRFETDTGIVATVNDTYIETRQLVEAGGARLNTLYGTIRNTNDTISVLRNESNKYIQQFLLNGSAGPNINDPEGSTTRPTAPFVAGAGFNLLSGVDFSRYDTVVKNTVYDGETIFALAQRTTGSVQMVPLIIAINKLQFPYFVGRDQPYLPGTKKWGDDIAVPAISSTLTSLPENAAPLVSTPPLSWAGTVTTSTTSTLTDTSAAWRDHQLVGYTVTLSTGVTAIIKDNTATTMTFVAPLVSPPVVSSAYVVSLIQQQKTNPITAIEAIYGVDAMLVFDKSNITQVAFADVFLSPYGDLARIAGFPNLLQAIYILFYTEQGRNVANPLYGLLAPVGEKNTVERLITLSFNARASLLADPRIQTVERIEFEGSGDTVDTRATVVPVGGQRQVIALPTSL